MSCKVMILVWKLLRLVFVYIFTTLLLLEFHCRKIATNECTEHRGLAVLCLLSKLSSLMADNYEKVLYVKG